MYSDSFSCDGVMLLLKLENLFEILLTLRMWFPTFRAGLPSRGIFLFCFYFLARILLARK